ncbi:hypothetical protein KSS87_015205 [Heliosperma pusillum]|nr:hypothetical protein KSS87_015205 [Heliosperma pusillum]
MEGGGANSEVNRDRNSTSSSRRYRLHLSASNFLRSPISALLEYSGLLRPRSSNNETEPLISGSSSGLPPAGAYDSTSSSLNGGEVSIRIIGGAEGDHARVETSNLGQNCGGSESGGVVVSGEEGRTEVGVGTGTGEGVSSQFSSSSADAEAADASGGSSREGNYQRYDIQQAARWIEQVLPFSLLLLVVFIRQHLQGFFITIWVSVFMFKSNDILRKHTALKGERKISVLIGYCILFTLHVVGVYWWYQSDDLLHPLIMLPPKEIPPFWHALFIIMINVILEKAEINVAALPRRDANFIVWLANRPLQDHTDLLQFCTGFEGDTDHIGMLYFLLLWVPPKIRHGDLFPDHDSDDCQLSFCLDILVYKNIVVRTFLVDCHGLQEVRHMRCTIVIMRTIDPFSNNKVVNKPFSTFSVVGEALRTEAPLNDTLVRQAAMIVKCVLLVYYKNSRGRNYRRQGQMLTLVEYLLLLYRALLPAPVWYRFFLNKEYGSLFSSLMTGLYLTFKLTSVVEKVQSFLAAVRALSRKEVHYGAYATSEQVTAAGDMCAICQEKMHTPILLRCKHLFCEDCVSE